MTSSIVYTAHAELRVIFFCFRCKISVFSVQMERPLTRRHRSVPIGVMWTVRQQPSTMVATTLTSTELDRVSKANGHHSLKKRKPPSIFRELRQVNSYLFICFFFFKKNMRTITLMRFSQQSQTMALPKM